MPTTHRDVASTPEMFKTSYGDVFDGDEQLAGASRRRPATFTTWDANSTYVKNPPFFDGHDAEAGAVDRHQGRARAGVARRLASRPTTSRRPASIAADSPAGKYLDRARRAAEGLQLLRRAARQPRGDGARHVRQRPPQNQLVPGVEGGVDACTCRPASRCRSTTRR